MAFLLVLALFIFPIQAIRALDIYIKKEKPPSPCEETKKSKKSKTKSFKENSSIDDEVLSKKEED